MAQCHVASRNPHGPLDIPDVRRHPPHGMGITVRQRRALEASRYLIRQGRMSINEVAKHLGITKASAQELLAPLREQGLLKAPVQKVVGEWKVTSAGEKLIDEGIAELPKRN